MVKAPAVLREPRMELEPRNLRGREQKKGRGLGRVGWSAPPVGRGSEEGKAKRGVGVEGLPGKHEL